MTKLFGIAVSLKATLIAASFALARGDMLSVILISALFNLAQLGAKPMGQTESVSAMSTEIERQC